MASSAVKIAREWVGKVAIVTGASAGIGLDLIRALASSGIKTIGCARNISKIEVAASNTKGNVSGEISAFKCDVSKEEEVKSMFEMAGRKYGGVDILVNNAGLAYDAPLLSGSTEEWKAMLEVNVLGLSMCTREFFQKHQQRKAGGGYIINISSILGHIVPSYSLGHFYSASKFAVTTLTEGTRHELRDIKSSIKISQVSPGYVFTEFRGRLYKDMAKGEELYKESLKNQTCVEAKDITDSILYLLSTPPNVCIHDMIVRPLQQTL